HPLLAVPGLAAGDPIDALGERDVHGGVAARTGERVAQPGGVSLSERRTHPEPAVRAHPIMMNGHMGYMSGGNSRVGSNAMACGPHGTVSTRMKRILVVEDDHSIADLVRSTLASEGFTVEVARTGTAALTTFRSFAPDLVILDRMLPEMDGFEILREIRKLS